MVVSSAMAMRALDPSLRAAIPLAALLLSGCLELGGSWALSGTTGATATTAGGSTSSTTTTGVTTTASADTSATTDTDGCAPDEVFRCMERVNGECGLWSVCVDPLACDPEMCSDDGQSGQTCADLCGDSYICAPSGDPGRLRCIPDPALSQCSAWVQDCPEGYKCAVWANDGGSSWNSTKCVPLDPRPKQLEETCTAPSGGVSGEDDCDRGLMCWNVNPETQQGTCAPFCTGSYENLECPPGYDCSLFFSRSGADGALCLPGCDPLAQDCPGDDLCLPAGDGWHCVLDASGEAGAFGDPCEYTNACDAGLLCLYSEYVPDCQAGGCCSPLCDIEAPNSCPGDGQVCIPWYEEGMAPPGYEKVGVCGVPL